MHLLCDFFEIYFTRTRYDFNNFKLNCIKLKIYCLEPPKISKDYLPLKTVSEGEFFSVVCSVGRGSQPLFFQWFKNGQTINKQSDDLQITLFNELQSILNIKKVTSSDSGNYTCEVKNTFGEDTFTSQLIVRGTNEFI